GLVSGGFASTIEAGDVDRGASGAGMTGFGAACAVSIGSEEATGGFASSTEVASVESALDLGVLSESSGGAAAGVTSRPIRFGFASLPSHACRRHPKFCDVVSKF